MTEQQHPITPPQNLIYKWRTEAYHQDHCGADDYFYHKIAEWGWEQRGADIEAKLQKARDEELEACCEEMKSIPSPLGIPFGEMASNALRAARRPKSKSQAEEALEAVAAIENMSDQYVQFEQDIDTIRSALKRLQEHEQQVEAHVND